MKKFIDICQFSLVLMGLMVCGLFVTSLLGMLPLGAPGSPAMQWTIFAGQNIIAFILPAMLAWKICFKASPIMAIEADKAPSARMIGIAVLVYLIAMPALNQTVYWNQEMHLPEAFSAFEQWCREMEALAEQQTEALLNTDNVWHMIMNILVIGVLTGIGEEFFFRGALQRMLEHCKVNPHIAIWTAAIVFSLLHFQFFGFVPRVLLGAWFGYLYRWSGSIWVNSFAHALNNSLVILSAWCINHGLTPEGLDMTGVSESGFPTWAMASAIATGITLWLINRRHPLAPDNELPPTLPTNTDSNATESN